MDDDGKWSEELVVKQLGHIDTDRYVADEKDGEWVATEEALELLLLSETIMLSSLQI